jgi:hypothetical protein
MPELPRVNYLVWLSVVCAHNAYWILDSDPRTVSFSESHEELDAGLLATIRSLLSKPLGSRHGEIGAWWERDYHVPLGIQMRNHVALMVPLRMPARARKDVARECVMATSAKRLGDSLRLLASHEYLHDSSFGNCSAIFRAIVTMSSWAFM